MKLFFLHVFLSLYSPFHFPFSKYFVWLILFYSINSAGQNNQQFWQHGSTASDYWKDYVERIQNDRNILSQAPKKNYLSYMLQMVFWKDITFHVEIGHINHSVHHEKGSKTQKALTGTSNPHLTVYNHRMADGNSNNWLPDMGQRQ